ncbi:hypothetical protein EDD18DRAFT_1164938 [Armillaria luteobubalina]|uniref:Uncharacterized protein n=1 Tax=Armillaria luteobubalina TaxID=153913 RepID=A0AA39Q675_9AGAR|nr:hypothetical protein EDD18DRAFT_1164938 [Armillaria luteobubalina]
MLKKLDGMQKHKYAGHCSDTVDTDEEEAVYTIVSVRPVQQDLTKPHPRKPQHARPTMCIPILPTTDHPRSRKPFKVSKRPLPWENCYHPTCYDICIRVPTERQDYYHSPSAAGNLTPELMKAFREDKLHRDLLTPDTDISDDASQTSADSQASQMFLAEVPGCDNLEEDYTFIPVMRFDHVLSNAPEICDPSQLCGDLDVFQEIVQEYQLARYGSAVFPEPEPEMEITPFPDDYSSVYGSESGTSGTSTEDLNSESPDSHALDLSLAVESHGSSNQPAPVPPRKGKLKFDLVFRRAIKNLVQFLKGHKFSAKL